jgi:TetR/AcrR family transcriptional regulator, cholesterol catabolism regulator
MASSLRTSPAQRLRRPRKKSPGLALPRAGKDEPGSSRRSVIEEHLLDVAAKRFASTGYRQTTLEEIARHAGIAKASMYRYFENKQELLAKIFVKVASTYTTSLQPILTTALPPEEKLRRAVQHLLHTIGENVSFFTVFYSEEADLPPKLRAEVMETRQRLAANLESIVQEGIEQGDFRPLDAKLMVYAIMGMCGWLHKWYRPGEARLEDVTTAFIGLIEHGCLATRGTEAQAGLTDRLRHVQDLLESAIGQAERLEKNGQSGRRS